MNAEQLNKLKNTALAAKAKPGETDWYTEQQFAGYATPESDVAFIVAMTPCVALELIAIAERALAAPTPDQASQKPYGWLTGESTSHRQGNLQDLTTNYEWAKEICDKNNAENRFIDPDWVDEIPTPLYAAAQAPERADSRDGELERAYKDREMWKLRALEAEYTLRRMSGSSNAADGVGGVGPSTTGDAAIGEKGNG